MRPNQNRRMRGRNRPKGPNPLTRSYESNGPDVKLRGTAQHIADKYAQLARDALASGDPIAAENYFQHGEHYFRIITGAQEPHRPQSTQGYARHAFEDEEEGDEDGLPNQTGPQGDQGREHGRQGYGGDEYGDPAQQPQPYERHDYDARQNRNDRQDNRRDRFQNRNDRPQRFDNNRQDQRGDYGRPDYRQDRPDRQDPRNDYGRQDYGPRQDYRQDARGDQNRPDHGRNDQPRDRDGGRYENGRGDQGRHEGGRSDQPRQDRQDFQRRDRRREEPVSAADPDASALPAFLMTATRNAPPPSGEEPAPRARSEDQDDAVAAAGVEDAAPAAPKPRRRRARYKGGEAPDGAREDGASADTPSAAE